MDVGGLFGGVMTYPIAAGVGNGKWAGAAPTYTYTVMGAANTFTYNPADGTFLCTAGSYCAQLTN